MYSKDSSLNQELVLWHADNLHTITLNNTHFREGEIGSGELVILEKLKPKEQGEGT